MKNFSQWTDHKTTIEELSERKLFNIREVWWCTLGLNVGREQDGKNNFFERPVLVIKKFSRDTFLCAPLTTKKKEITFQKELVCNDKKSYVLLDQIRVVDSKRLIRKIGFADKVCFLGIMSSLKNFL